MFHTKEKLRNRIGELKGLRYRDAIEVPIWKFKLDEKGKIGARPPKMDGSESVRLGHRWSGRDVYAWLEADVYVPAEWGEQRVVGLFDLGKSGGGNASGFESLLFLDGHPYQGVDTNHGEVFLPADAANRTLRLSFRLWSGLEGGGVPREREHRLEQAQLAWLDEATDDVFFTGLSIVQALDVLPESSPDAIELLNALDEAVRLIDFASPASDTFYASVQSARDSLNKSLASLTKESKVTIRSIGHTHIDVAYLWRLRHTREKAARSFTTALRLMEMFPEFVFLQTQPQLYEYLKTDYPEIYDAIRSRVGEGRWEADGAMWLEADCNLTSGESLVRQILFGTRFFKREFGRECKYLWLPDVFGYSSALPQILRKSGIEIFMTTKISWNQYNRMPHDTFMWRGLDGSEIVTHFITTPEPNPQSWFYTYNGEMTASTVAGSWEAYRDKRMNRELLLAYGYGDGGGGVTRDMLEMRRRLDALPGLPAVSTGRADEYFSRLLQTVRETREYVHTWDGELYLEYHRGTYTSQAYNKRMNRKLELLLRETEWLSVLAGLMNPEDAPSRDGHERLALAWKILLRNQFHDIIPGSSIHEVYEDSRAEYEEALALVNQVQRESIHALQSDDDEKRKRFTVYNSAGFDRAGIARISREGGFTRGRFVNCDSMPLASQQVEDEVWVRVSSVPAFGSTQIQFVTDAEHPASGPDCFTVHANGVTTPFYEIRWNHQGQWTSLVDLSAAREVLKPDHRGNVLQVFEDKPLGYDAWDIDIFYQEKMREVTDLVEVKAVSVGPICAVFRFVWRYGSSDISQRMVLYADSPRIDFETVADWQEHHQLLKVAFPIDVRATSATYDIQFGNTKRPTHWNTSWDLARFESVAHQWADVSENGYGVSLANDCKYGYDIKDGVLRLSLIKSATYPDPQADVGSHEFTYTLIPHRGDFLQARVPQHAWDLNSPLLTVPGPGTTNGNSLFRVSSDSVMVDAVKLAEDENRIVLRLHDFSGGRQTVLVSTDFEITSWQESDLMERPISELCHEPMEFTLCPYEIKTFLLDVQAKGTSPVRNAFISDAGTM